MQLIRVFYLGWLVFFLRQNTSRSLIFLVSPFSFPWYKTTDSAMLKITLNPNLHASLYYLFHVVIAQMQGVLFKIGCWLLLEV